MTRSQSTPTVRCALALTGRDLRAAWQCCRTPALHQLAPLLGMLVLLCAAFWAVGAYASFKAQLRIAETDRYLAQFDEPPVADAWRRLSRVWQAESRRQDALLRRLAGLSDTKARPELNDYRSFIMETIADHELERDIVTVLQFYRRLALCIRIGSCDQDAAAAQLGDTPWRFRNQHYFLLEAEYLGDDLESDLELISPRQPAAGKATGGAS